MRKCPHCGEDAEGLSKEDDGRDFYYHGDGKYCVIYPKGWFEG